MGLRDGAPTLEHKVWVLFCVLWVIGYQKSSGLDLVRIKESYLSSNEVQPRFSEDYCEHP